MRNSFDFSDEQNARITSDAIVKEEMQKLVATNLKLYKLFTDNTDFKVDFSAMMFGAIKAILRERTGL